ncbi:nitroreductase family protein [Nitrospirillum bahiense]|uniref:Nitroreductase n=1 Tax=Nitrospirillum amazonense TaxID=28077 RepID=A0A560G3B4_9PROT|nr:nitroreductase family protein [Nitrospirillum amazonense]TWB28349.1 nitroreductase [Nitrospirillum amazonense]
MTTDVPQRTADHPIDPDILARWSPRAFDGSTLDDATLATLFEAARWAPSAFNAQPWRFVYAHRGTPEWEALLSALVPRNAAWVQHASVLLFVLSDTLFLAPGQTDPVPATTNSFDAGAAWALLALQAQKLGLHTHAMAGFDRARATEVTGAGDRFRIEAAVAIGRKGDPATLPEPLRAREFPSPRRPLAETAYRGRLP